MRALITGGAGFIGSHLAEALLERGDEVSVLDDLSTGQLENIEHLFAHPRFSYIIDSVTNAEAVSSAMGGVDTVFHLAAAVGVRLVIDRPIHTIETNVNGTATVLEAASQTGAHVIVASTSEVYGKGVSLPFREDADLVLGPPTKTRWGYATSKLLDEFMTLGYWKERRLPATVVRLFNSVGPRQSGRYGMVIPNFVKQALSDKTITIHGDGSQTRSFTWVGDVVAALLLLAGEPKAVGEVFNVGNPAEISVKNLALRVKHATSSQSPLAYVPYDLAFGRDFEDMARRVPDITKLQRLTGYQPRVQLDEIIARTAAYWREEAADSAQTIRGGEGVPVGLAHWQAVPQASAGI
jgi:UDP-glucose 4-epimerase